MDNNQEKLVDNDMDLELSKPKSSRFLFVLGFFGIFIFAWSGCYNLYKHKTVLKPVAYDDATYKAPGASAETPAE